MKGDVWLVCLMHTMDDFPIRLFDSYEAAAAFVDANPLEDDIDTTTHALKWGAGPEVMEAYELWDRDASTPVGYSVSHFKNGILTGFETRGTLGD